MASSGWRDCVYTKTVMRHAKHIYMKFSDQILKNAIVSVDNEFAWKKEYAIQAIIELTENNIAILGGDVWAVTENLHKQSILTQIDKTNFAIGIIKGKDGLDYVFEWHSTKNLYESWEAYVLRSKNESMESINQMNAEEMVVKKYKNLIYYNLVYANQIEYENLK